MKKEESLLETKTVIELIKREVKENKKSVRMSKDAWKLIQIIIEKIKIVPA